MTDPIGRSIVDVGRVGPPVGSRLPDVGLPDQSGHLVDLHAYRAGRPALVVLYRSAKW
jgi:peroxiredoxin